MWDLEDINGYWGQKLYEDRNTLSKVLMSPFHLKEIQYVGIYLLAK